MTEEQRKNLNEKLKYNQEQSRKKVWTNHTLFQECLASIETYRILPALEESQVIAVVNSKIETIPYSKKIPNLCANELYYIVWDNMDVPIVECNGMNILNHFDDVSAVAFETAFLEKNSQNIFLYKH